MLIVGGDCIRDLLTVVMMVLVRVGVPSVLFSHRIYYNDLHESSQGF